MHKPGQLSSMAESYDLVIIDAPPRHGDVQRSALMVADLAVLPCGPSAAEAWALAGTLELVNEARTMRDELQACILITRKQGRTSLAKGARSVLETSGLPVLSTELSSRIAYQEAIAAGMGVTTYAPRDAASKEIVSLLEEIERICHGEEAAERVDSEGVVCAAE
jgi:chromosome partitioning protein